SGPKAGSGLTSYLKRGPQLSGQQTPVPLVVRRGPRGRGRLNPGPGPGVETEVLRRSTPTLAPEPRGPRGRIEPRVPRDPLLVPVRDAGPGRNRPLGAGLPGEAASPAGPRPGPPAAGPPVAPG